MNTPPRTDLNLTLIQTELHWEDPAKNRAHIAQLLSGISTTDLIILPEMFTTGFSMNALANAETTGGDTQQWMQALASEHNCAISGSIAVRDGDTAYNRMLFVTPERCEHYDKRHLFRMAGEHKRYGIGDKRVVVSWRGWRILLQVCYDLRFPVWSRNRDDYDLALYVANWPSPRAYAWRQLLIARAIENQCCVAGVNRIGEDANGNHYSGDSLVCDAQGQRLTDRQNKNGAAQITLSGADLTAFRQNFPCWRDADNFSIDTGANGE